MPRVSVIIATYNRSATLYYAIRSALWQTFQDFEILVIGDACTDDSADVVAAFGDARIRWRNLESNSGSQSLPNSTALRMARGTYAAYLGHDDLWYPNHLELLVEAAERNQADVAYTAGIMVGPPGSDVRLLTGVSESGEYEPELLAPPSTFMHRIDSVGAEGWKDFRTLHTPMDIAFLSDAWAAGKKFAPVPEITVFKLPASWRKDVYLEKPSAEQAEYARRIQHEPDFWRRELTAVALAYAKGKLAPAGPGSEPPVGAPAGWRVNRWRQWRGLNALPPLAEAPLYSEAGALRAWNSRHADITPQRTRDALFASGNPPASGLFLGRGWHGIERTAEPECDLFRWVAFNAEIVVTNPDRLDLDLCVEAESGPSAALRSIALRLLDANGERLGTQIMGRRRETRFPLSFSHTAGAVFRLQAEGGGRKLEGEDRILDFRVFHLELRRRAI